jgi:hypothetical protein
MKQDEVLQTLRKVIAESDNFTTWTVSTPHLVELVKRAVEAEREACAKVCDDLYKKWVDDLINDTDDTADSGTPDCVDCQVAIRARGQA